MQSYEVNGRSISFKVHEFEGKKSFNEYEKSIYLALKKIGVTKEYISIDIVNDGVKVSWSINGSLFSFQCHSQSDSKSNAGAVAQAIQEDVRQILRGIKDLNLVMKQYEETSSIQFKKKSIADYGEGFEEEYIPENQEEFPLIFSSDIEAKETIKKIKEKYANFTDLSLIPEQDKKSLRQAYLYLGIVVKF